ncbi:MAG: hypothetical protein ACHP7O_02115 [Burkholderiales bacterium]
MSISSINQYSSPYTNSQYTTTNSVNVDIQISDITSTGNSIAGTTGGSGGNFASAISQALTQIGVTPANSSSSAGSTPSSTSQTPAEALKAFAQNLFAALQSQSGTQASDSGAKSHSGHGYRHGGGGSGNIQSALQSLIQQLPSSSGQSTSGSGTASTSTSGSTSGSAIDALQTSFNNLLSADGVSGTNATLKNFLQTLSQNLQGTSSTGNVINTTS